MRRYLALFVGAWGVGAVVTLTVLLLVVAFEPGVAAADTAVVYVYRGQTKYVYPWPGTFVWKTYDSYKQVDISLADRNYWVKHVRRHLRGNNCPALDDGKFFSHALGVWAYRVSCP